MIELLAVLLATGAVFVMARKYSPIAGIIWCSYLLRLCVAFVHIYLRTFPDSGNAANFERLGWELAAAGPQAFISHLLLFDQYLFSLLIALCYAVVGRVILVPHLLNVVVGVGIVILTYVLARRMWNHRIGVRSAWLVALTPSTIVYSAVLLRDVVVIFLLLASLACAVRVRQSYKASYALAAVFFALGAVAFHPGAILALGVVLLAVAPWPSLTRRRARWLTMTLRGIVLVPVFLGGLYMAYGAGVGSYRLGAAYRGDFTTAAMRMYPQDDPRLVSRTDTFYTVDCARTAVDLVWCIPARLLEFVVSPVPWRVNQYWDLVRVGESLIVSMAFLIVLIRLQRLWRNPGGKVLLAATGALILIFGIGSKDSWQSYRHRAKVVPIVLLLAAGAIRNSQTRGPVARPSALKRPSPSLKK